MMKSGTVVSRCKFWAKEFLMTDTNQTFTGRVSLLKHLLYGSKRFFGAGIALG